MLTLLHPFARRSAAIVTACALTACSTLPTYHQPEAAVPTQYAGAAAPGWSVDAPADAKPPGPWWTLFHDAELDQLEARVDVSNQTVAKAVAQLQAARAMLDYQRAGYAPTVDRKSVV